VYFIFCISPYVHRVWKTKTELQDVTEVKIYRYIQLITDVFDNVKKFDFIFTENMMLYSIDANYI
jgi:chemotaxis methyl-accepting protein methylase